MEAYLIEYSNVLALGSDELSNLTVLDDEVPVLDGRPGKCGAGRIDLIAQYGESTFERTSELGYEIEEVKK